jgi:hypothetical protein
MRELRLSNQNVLKQNIVQNDLDYAKEIADIEKNFKYAELGSKIARDFVVTGMAEHKLNKQRNAIKSAAEFRHKDKLGYLNSDKATGDINELSSANIFSRELNNTAANFRMQGIDANIINKIKASNPTTGMLLANADLARLAARYPELIAHHFSNDETVLPGMGKSIKEIGLSGTYDEKLAVHNFLKGEYLRQIVESGYNTDYLMLSTEVGGSGFFDAIDGHDVTLLEGYSKSSDILKSAGDISFAWGTFLESGKSDDFVAWVQAIRTGVNDKNEAYIQNMDKFTKYVDENISNGIKSGMINKQKLDVIAHTIVPGTENDERYPLYKDGKVIGYGQTYAEKWPTKYGYDPDKGIIGSYYQQIAEFKSAESERIEGTKQSEFDSRKGDIIESINSMINQGDRARLYGSLAEEFGELDGFDDITAAYNASNEIEDNEENVDLVVNKHASGNLIQHIVPDNTQLAKNSTVAGLLEAEKKITSDSKYKEGLIVIGNKLNSDFKKLGEESSIMVGDELLLYRTLENKYYNYVKNGKTSDEARDLVVEEWIAGGGGDRVTNAEINNPDKAKVLKDTKGITSNKYSLNAEKQFMQRLGGGVPEVEEKYGINLISRTDRLSNIKKTIQSIADTNKISPEEALTKIDSETELPLYTIEGESKELLKNALDNIDNIKSFPSMYTDIAEALNKPTSDVLNWRLKANGLGELPEKFVKECGAGIRKYCKQTVVNQLNGKGPKLYPWEYVQAEVAKAATLEAQNNGGETPESQTVIAAACGGEGICVASEGWFEENGITPTADDLNVIVAYLNQISAKDWPTDMSEDVEVELASYLLDFWRNNPDLFNEYVNTQEMQKELYALTGKKTGHKFNFLLPIPEETNSE